ncbi:WbqC family protein [Pseudomonadales bacterium]|nr:WbqC family protein [Pseudomonadales bacterium]
MILSAHQPVYLPWLGLFHKIALADCFCIFDIAQYQKRDFNNRNRIKTADGSMLLTVPVNAKGRFDDQIKNTKIAHDQWKSQHFKAIYFNYKKAPFFNNYIDELEAIYFGKEYSYLSDLNTTMLKFFLEKLGITAKIITASDYSFVGKKSNLVLNMCQSLQAEKIIFGENGRDYVDTASFRESGIEVFFQNYSHPEYKQCFQKDGFLSHLSIIDLLFNEGNQSKDIIMSGNIQKV